MYCTARYPFPLRWFARLPAPSDEKFREKKKRHHARSQRLNAVGGKKLGTGAFVLVLSYPGRGGRTRTLLRGRGEIDAAANASC